MSAVQKRVLKLMPYLAGGVPSDEVDTDDPAIEEIKANGRQDLLVKAKTGTGKTIVSSSRERPWSELTWYRLSWYPPSRLG